MAKQRVISTHFWNDDYIIDLRADEKLLFLYILTNPQTDLCGAYQIALKQMAFHTKITPRRVEAILSKFRESGKVCYHRGWILIRNFAKHQCQTNPRVSKGIERSLNACPDWVKEALNKGFDRLSRETAPELLPQPEPFGTHNDAGEDFPEPVWGYPMKQLVETFPHLTITPAMIGFIEAEVKSGDEIAWQQTLSIYKMNFNPAAKSYMPEKTANLLGVFKSEKEKLNKNGSNKTYFGKRTDDDVIAQSKDFYENYPT